MDRDAWQREYGRLCTAYGKSPNPETARVYFSALSTFPSVCVVDAVTEAIRESRSWPSAADLSERARLARPKHLTPAAVCDVCHGDGWTIEELPEQPYHRLPGRRGDPVPPPVMWTPQQARRCWQCRPSVREGAA